MKPVFPKELRDRNKNEGQRLACLHLVTDKGGKMTVWAPVGPETFGRAMSFFEDLADREERKN